MLVINMYIQFGLDISNLSGPVKCVRDNRDFEIYKVLKDPYKKIEHRKSGFGHRESQSLRYPGSR